MSFGIITTQMFEFGCGKQLKTHQAELKLLLMIIVFVLWLQGGSCNDIPGTEEIKSFYDPDMMLIEPQARTGTKTALQNVPQWGGVRQGKSNFMAQPNSYGFIKWQTRHPDQDGMCRLRISEGFSEEEESYSVLPLASGTVTEEGWFKCGRLAHTFEQRKIKFPDIVCDLCTLQLQFRTAQGIIFQWADISLVAGENLSCDGLCMNGGSCVNGKCLCPSGYGGKFWDGIGAFEGNTPSLWFILFIILLIIAFMVTFALCVIRFINKQEKRYHKTSPENSQIPDVLEDTVFGNGSTHYDRGEERRSKYKHQKFDDDDEY